MGMWLCGCECECVMHLHLAQQLKGQVGEREGWGGVVLVGEWGRDCDVAQQLGALRRCF